MKVLIIYEILSENLKVAIAEMSDDEYEYFSKVHGLISNVHEMTKEQIIINNILSGALSFDDRLTLYGEDSIAYKYFGKWHGRDISEITNISDCEKIIYTGAALY